MNSSLRPLKLLVIHRRNIANEFVKYSKKCYFTYVVHIHDDIVGFCRTKYKVWQNGHCQNEIGAKTNHFSKRIEIRLYVCHHKNRFVSGEKKRLLTQFTMTTDIK